MNALTEAQNSFEQRFNCSVCLCPKLRMVYSICQHRVCVDCLYESDGTRRPSMARCPTCQMVQSYPRIRPDIPDDNIEMQKCLGVRICPFRGCSVEMWEWEVEAHLKESHSKKTRSRSEASTPSNTPKKRRSTPKKPDESRRSSRSNSSSSGIATRLRSRHNGNTPQ